MTRLGLARQHDRFTLKLIHPFFLKPQTLETYLSKLHMALGRLAVPCHAAMWLPEPRAIKPPLSLKTLGREFDDSGGGGGGAGSGRGQRFRSWCEPRPCFGKILARTEAGHVERVDLGASSEWGWHATALVLTSNYTSFRVSVNDLRRGRTLEGFSVEGRASDSFPQRARRF